jgi:uncharacterized BrkB/YihY/UPF0761 family membrane protein
MQLTTQDDFITLLVTTKASSLTFQFLLTAFPVLWMLLNIQGLLQ